MLLKKLSTLSLALAIRLKYNHQEDYQTSNKIILSTIQQQYIRGNTIFLPDQDQCFAQILSHRYHFILKINKTTSIFIINNKYKNSKMVQKSKTSFCFYLNYRWILEDSLYESFLRKRVMAI